MSFVDCALPTSFVGSGVDFPLTGGLGRNIDSVVLVDMEPVGMQSELC